MILKCLLAFVPIAIALEYLTLQSHLLIFVAAAVAILPLAAWLGRATEQLADRSGEGVGGLLNATFGDAAELIIALAALHAGLHDVVKATIVGSIVGNILLGSERLCLPAACAIRTSTSMNRLGALKQQC
jgi:Ca2+:H+ antiporter